jgi:energy-coupling factor transporter transmembrane protein EcfT
MTFHPLTHMIVAGEAAFLAAMLPVDEGAVVFSIGLFFALVIPSRTEIRITGTLLRVLALAGFFLFLIHGVKWNPPEILFEGLRIGLANFLHIAAPITAILYLSRRIRAEELYAFLMDMRISASLVFIIFRTLWLIPRLKERIDEVITAMKLRGIRIETPIQRIKVLSPALGTIFASMIREISENSLTIASRGFLRNNRKTHLLVLPWGSNDTALILISTFIAAVIWF